jgi:CYTH domain-containing protein
MKGPKSIVEAERRFVLAPKPSATPTSPPTVSRIDSTPQPQTGERFDRLPAGAVQVGRIEQGYLISGQCVELRVRTGVEHSAALKVGVGRGRRLEFETALPSALAFVFLRVCPWRLSKTRWVVELVDQRWDVDLYHGTLTGLITAEAETENFDTLHIPEWDMVEVTGEVCWSNRALARRGLPEM